MKQTKKLTISSMAVALGTLFMVVGAYIETLDLTAVALASVLVAFIYIEIGSPYTWLVWICTSALTFILYPHSLMWLMYLIMFGIYPVLKGYIEKLKRVFWLPLKLVYGNITFAIVIFGAGFLTGIPFIDPNDDFFGLTGTVIYVLTWILLNIAFVAYDFFTTVMVRFYIEKIRPKIKNLLK